MEQPGTISTAGSNPAVEITDPAGVVVRQELKGDRHIIGRSQDVHIHLPSTHVSRRHAELSRDPFGRWWVRDLGSQNGTLVNGAAIKEFVVGSGDEINVGEFKLRLVLPSAPHEHTTVTTGSISVSAAAMGRISTLKDHEAPRIARHHLTCLADLHRHLQNVGDITERYRQLCATLISPEFHGLWAVALRIPTDAADPEPVLLCEPQLKNAGEPMGPVSRSLLRAVQAKREAVMAARTVAGAAEVALSMTGAQSGVAALACPLEHDNARIDLLYVMLPGQYATGEWLALAGLAAEEFQHAEAARRARAQAASHAALERELDSARDLQMSLIPKQITYPGVDIGVGFMPCRWVGGDYVDVVPMADGRLLFAVADVCGKGLPAALLASRVHTGVHSSLAAGMNLQQLMTNLNNYLCDTIPSTSFVTMIALAIDFKTGQIQYVNAGHPPPLLAQPGTAEGRELPSAVNYPLGLEKGELTAQTEQIMPGQILALYTDGLTELTTEANEMLGIEGLSKELLKICADAHITARTGADALTQRLAVLLGDQLPQDDRTFLLIKRL